MPDVISLFSGCGGMDLGVQGGFRFLGRDYPRTDFDVVWANDIDEFACATLARNFEPLVPVHEDIAKIGICALPNADMVIGGFPCQDFSITRATQRRGIKVKRGKLYSFFVRVVSEKRPAVFIAENVKGILSANGGKAIDLICKEFARIDGGYNIYCDLYKFVDYGVPQYRERVLIIGIRSDVQYRYVKPQPTVRRHISSGTALRNIPRDASNNELMRTNPRTRQMLEAIEEGRNVRSLGTDHPLFVKGLMSNIYRKLDREKPSTTIIAGGGGGTWGYHYEEPRPLTNRERARLQGFPDSFVFEGSNTEVRRQIGNAVPPVGIYPVAVELSNAFEARQTIPQPQVEINICGRITQERLDRNEV